MLYHQLLNHLFRANVICNQTILTSMNHQNKKNKIFILYFLLCNHD